jgi:putative IMPACT (imprinted ancient) family translation regulator
VIYSFDSEIIEEVYDDDVSFRIELPKNSEDSFVAAITDSTGGRVLIRK